MSIESNEQNKLYLACKENRTDDALKLIWAGEDVNVADNNGWTPLHWACLNNNLELSNELTKNNAEVNFSNEVSSPLFLACSNNNAALSSVLVAHGAVVDEDSKELFNKLSLLSACINNDTKAALDLIKENVVDINKVDQNGCSPLYVACILNNKDLALALIAHGADVNKANKDGYTPLYYACKNQNTVLSQALIAKGAKADVLMANPENAEFFNTLSVLDQHVKDTHTKDTEVSTTIADTLDVMGAGE